MVFARGLVPLAHSLPPRKCPPGSARQCPAPHAALCSLVAVVKPRDQRGQEAGPRSHSREEAPTWGWMIPECSDPALAAPPPLTPPPGLAPSPPWAVTAPKGRALLAGGGPCRDPGRPEAAGQDTDLAGGEVSILAPGAGPGPEGPRAALQDPQDPALQGWRWLEASVPPVCPGAPCRSLRRHTLNIAPPHNEPVIEFAGSQFPHLRNCCHTCPVPLQALSGG